MPVGWGSEAPSDEALIDAIGEESQEALGEIYRRHGGAVWSVATKVCRQTELAEEVCETVFAELWSHPERFDPTRCALRAWLVARAHSHAVARIRSDDTRRRQAGEAPMAATPPSAEVEVAAHVGALGEGARRALDRLSPGERDAILLAYVGGHPYSETARLLGTPEDTVKRRIRSGLLNLRRAPEGEGVTR
jgi:RNA polymerase sigma-70 factor, ECF subfamily